MWLALPIIETYYKASTVKREWCGNTVDKLVEQNRNSKNSPTHLWIFGIWIIPQITGERMDFLISSVRIIR